MLVACSKAKDPVDLSLRLEMGYTSIEELNVNVARRTLCASLPMMFNHDLRTRIICSLGSFRIQLTFQGTSKIGVNFYKLRITEITIINNHYH